jgi:predicted ABC-type ATPase
MKRTISRLQVAAVCRVIAVGGMLLASALRIDDCRALRERDIDFGEYINPDDIARGLEGNYGSRVSQAQVIADRRREECIAGKRSFSFETVMSHPSKVDVLVRANAAGFFVRLFFVGTDDPRTNVDRVMLRVAQGGHNVPEDRIVARWHRTMKMLHQAIQACDDAFVFDNSPTVPLPAGARLVFHRAYSAARADFETQQFPPVPDWIRNYVLDPLGVAVMSPQENESH